MLPEGAPHLLPEAHRIHLPDTHAETQMRSLLLRMRTMAAVLLYGIFQSLKTFLCIMEILYRFMQGLCRVICQHFLEFSKCNCTFIKILRFFRQIIAYCIGNKNISSPAFSVFICQECLPVLCRNQVQNLPFRISSLLKNFFFRCPVTPAMFSISSSGF